MLYSCYFPPPQRASRHNQIITLKSAVLQFDFHANQFQTYKCYHCIRQLYPDSEHYLNLLTSLSLYHVAALIITTILGTQGPYYNWGDAHIEMQYSKTVAYWNIVNPHAIQCSSVVAKVILYGRICHLLERK